MEAPSSSRFALPVGDELEELQKMEEELLFLIKLRLQLHEELANLAIGPQRGFKAVSSILGICSLETVISDISSLPPHSLTSVNS